MEIYWPLLLCFDPIFDEPEPLAVAWSLEYDLLLVHVHDLYGVCDVSFAVTGDFGVEQVDSLAHHQQSLRVFFRKHQDVAEQSDVDVLALLAEYFWPTTGPCTGNLLGVAIALSKRKKLQFHNENCSVCCCGFYGDGVDRELEEGVFCFYQVESFSQLWLCADGKALHLLEPGDHVVVVRVVLSGAQLLDVECIFLEDLHGRQHEIRHREPLASVLRVLDVFKVDGKLL